MIPPLFLMGPCSTAELKEGSLASCEIRAIRKKIATAHSNIPATSPRSFCLLFISFFVWTTFFFFRDIVDLPEYKPTNYLMVLIQDNITQNGVMCLIYYI